MKNGIDYGKIAYDGYVYNTEGKSLITGEELPKFEDLPVEVQTAWASAAVSVISAFDKEIGR